MSNSQEIIFPEQIAAVGEELAIRWSDGRESYYRMEFLRAASPSAENTGERDLLGKVHGGDVRRSFPGVRVVSWQPVGGYALQIKFSDGHRTGLFSFSYLREIEALQGTWSNE